ncbi:MAG: ATP-binding protein, partial [Bacteroidota bacterium]|nr:ATP-binding protein [Bacteroidota bacterium]
TKERELLSQKNRLQQFRMWLLVSGSVIIGFIFVIYFLQQRNKARLNREQISSAKRIIDMEESEKGRTARELHDITGQLVMGITGSLESIDFPDPSVKDDLREKIKDLSHSIRLISHRMNRAMIDTFTFEELIVGQCEDVQKLSGLPIHLTLPSEPVKLPEEAVLHIYRMVQEMLTNATKYAVGGEVWISLQKGDHSLGISYQDTGPGFDTQGTAKKGMGMMNIYERTRLLRGKATVYSAPGDGTSWEISIPLLS